MKREDIINASIKYKEKEKRAEGNFYNDVSLDGVASAFIKGSEWRINSVWHDKTVKPEIDELIICVFEKEKLLGVVRVIQKDIFLIASHPERILYSFEEVIKWAYVKDLMFNMED